jgi:hypothetical protein
MRINLYPCAESVLLPTLKALFDYGPINELQVAALSYFEPSLSKSQPLVNRKPLEATPAGSNISSVNFKVVRSGCGEVLFNYILQFPLNCLPLALWHHKCR